jgi:hypothetical protein
LRGGFDPVKLSLFAEAEAHRRQIVGNPDGITKET